MVDIVLKYATDAEPIVSASHAAKTCYQAEPPEWGELIDVENALFKTGHHTTLQHFYLTFEIDRIPIGLVTFGLHLASVFYNTDQRSGRFCGQMFDTPDYKEIEEMVKFNWADSTDAGREQVMDYVRRSVGLYQEFLPRAVEKAKELLKEERPKAKNKYLEQNAAKIAQEQLRMLVPVIFPTGLVYTINISALAALYRSAWTPGLRQIVEQMVALTLQNFPRLSFMFSPEGKRTVDWSPFYGGSRGAVTEPKLELVNFSAPLEIILPRTELVHPVDLLHFLPETMDNNTALVTTRAAMSVATMGQDQRHRTIGRSAPQFTGKFYLPPIVQEVGLSGQIGRLCAVWDDLRGIIPATMHTILAPYGAQVAYYKSGSVNAVFHEQGKRLCWCAQEEIYNMGVSLRQSLMDNGNPAARKLAVHLEPACYRTGKCAEGRRYCGRDIETRESEGYFPRRKV